MEFIRNSGDKSLLIYRLIKMLKNLKNEEEVNLFGNMVVFLIAKLID